MEYTGKQGCGLDLWNSRAEKGGAGGGDGGEKEKTPFKISVLNISQASHSDIEPVLV